MFETIATSLDSVLRKLRLKGRLTEKHVQEAMREIRRALLEADVHYKVVKDFVDKVSEEALGADVLKSVTPGQQVVKVVHDNLVELMGPEDAEISLAKKPPTIIVLAGLQGSGKTTTCAKLGLLLQKKKGLRPLMVAADVRRPAAIEQLKVLGEQTHIEVYSQDGIAPPQICRNAVNYAKSSGHDVVVMDTAGRLHIDAEMMEELRQIVAKVKPDQVYLVCDAMTGQDAVNSAKEFNDQLALDGVILTKLDGDARGGAALSVRAITGKPIKFVGVGEKLEKLEEFHSDRMARRILGMEDVVSLVEKAQEVIDQEEAQKMQERLLKAEFTLDDFLKQLKTVKKLGSLREIMGHFGLGGQMAASELDEKQMFQAEALIQSMTAEERLRPEIIGGSRRVRIAQGSGTTTATVAGLLKQFKQTQQMMKRFGTAGGMDPRALQGALQGGRLQRPGKMRSKRKKKRRKR